MKVAFLMPPTVAGRQNGVVSQALTWKAGLEALGVSVDLISPWETYLWRDYDAVHAFGTGHYLDILPMLKARRIGRIVLSPIFDSNRSEVTMNLLSRLNFRTAAWKTSWAALRSNISSVDAVLVRSEFEARKLVSIFGVPPSKIALCRLPVRFQADCADPAPERERICSHVSILSAPIKNVARLVAAARKYSFPLRLAGQISDTAFQRWLEEAIRGSDDIQYLGVLSDEDLRNLYQRSRVFALPSLMEGVGLVALEAAQDGADLVITDRGGPKEYFRNMARTVNPESIDEIGLAIRALLDGETHQPQLSGHVRQHYSVEASARELIGVYTEGAGEP